MDYGVKSVFIFWRTFCLGWHCAVRSESGSNPADSDALYLLGGR